MPGAEFRAEVRSARQHRGDRPARRDQPRRRPGPGAAYEAAVRGDQDGRAELRPRRLHQLDRDRPDRGAAGQGPQGHRTVRAFGLSEHYRQIFDITRLSDFMGIYADEDSAVTAAAAVLNPPVQHKEGNAMTEGSLITDVRELSSRASVIDLKGDVTASSEKALADAYTRASGKFTRTIVLNFSGLVHEQWRDRDAGDAAGAGQPPAPAPGRLRAERALPADLRADPPGRGDRHLRHRGRGVRRGRRP